MDIGTLKDFVAIGKDLIQIIVLVLTARQLIKNDKDNKSQPNKKKKK